MDKNNKNKISLFEAVRLNKKDMFRTMWRIEINFNITNHIDLKNYCDKNCLEQIKTNDIWQEIDFKIIKEKYFEKIKNQLFYESCVIVKNNFKSFGIHEKSANIFGHKINEIEIIEIKFSNNQEKDQNSYWGWFSYYENNINNIQNGYGLMSICVGGGAKHAEELGKGFAVKLDLKLIDKKFIDNWWNNLTDMTKIFFVEEILKLKADALEIRKNISYDEIKRIFNYKFV